MRGIRRVQSGSGGKVDREGRPVRDGGFSGRHLTGREGEGSGADLQQIRAGTFEDAAVKKAQHGK